MATASDVCVYSFIGVLAVFSIVYGVTVVFYGGIRPDPIKVNLALRPDIIVNETVLSQLPYQLVNISNSSINAVSTDVWWGLVEVEPRVYNWSLYAALFQTIQNNMTNAKVKAVINFHACSPGFFCDVDVPLPPWISSMNETNPNVFYTDVNGFSSFDYLTSGVDHIAFDPLGRTAVEIYAEFIQSFAQEFSENFDSLIFEVQIGLGPAGELRYPAFPVGQWVLPGIGQFQCYDSYLRAEYATYANKLQKTFNYLPAASALSYNNTPEESAFFGKPKLNGTLSNYGQFFLTWYSNRLIQHGSVILNTAQSIIKIYSPNVTIATKLGCMYWQISDGSHAAELTAGYMNYTLIAKMMYSIGASMEFGCFDLSDRDTEKIAFAHANPSQLVNEVLETAKLIGLNIEGTNTLLTQPPNYGLIETNSVHYVDTVTAFNFRYLDDILIDSLRQFKDFSDHLATPQNIHK